MEFILPEIVSVGIFRAQNTLQNKNITKKRTTTMFEFEIPVEEGGISYINSKAEQISPSVVICAKPGQVRQTRLPFKCYYIHFILKEGELYERLTDIPNFIKTERPDKYRDIFEKLYKYYESPDEEDDIILHSLTMELFYMIVKDSGKVQRREGLKANNHIVIERAIKYIKHNLTADLSLEHVAHIAGMSPIHFHNCFKTSTAHTLHQYVEALRIKKAKKLLVTTDYTLTKIAYECGFSSQSYFSYVFKRRTKLTPKEYAKSVFSKYDNIQGGAAK